jgi:hypothetical protein
MIVLYREAKYISAATAYLCPKRYLQWWHSESQHIHFSGKYSARNRLYAAQYDQCWQFMKSQECWYGRWCSMCCRIMPGYKWQAAGPWSAHFPVNGSEAVVSETGHREMFCEQLLLSLQLVSGMCFRWMLHIGWDGADDNPHSFQEKWLKQQFAIDVWPGINGNLLWGPSERPPWLFTVPI